MAYWIKAQGKAHLTASAPLPDHFAGFVFRCGAFEGKPGQLTDAANDRDLRAWKPPAPGLVRHFLPQLLVAESGHQPGQVVQRSNGGEECLEIHPRGAPGSAEPHGRVGETRL